MEILSRIKQSKLITVLFISGFLAKLFFIIFFNPEIQEVYYSAFLENINSRNLLDPWSSHLMAGGSVFDFPFGAAMINVMLHARNAR